MNNFLLHPRKDGRIEVPQIIVKKMGWNKDVYISRFDGGLKLSPKLGQSIINVKHSNGRIIIPKDILKNENVLFKRLRAEINGTSIKIMTEPQYYADLAESIVSAMDLDLAKHIIKSIYKKFPDLSFVKTDAELFLPNKENPICFRPVGLPYRFPAYYLNSKLLKLANGSIKTEKVPELFFIIPGIKKCGTAYSIGFLLVNSKLHGRISYIVSKNGGVHNQDIIIQYSNKDVGNFGSFRAYLGPREKLPDKILKTANRLCKNPKEFLLNNFSRIASQDVENIISCPANFYNLRGDLFETTN